MSEEDFWRNYFSHVFAVKSKYEAHQAGAPPVGGASFRGEALRGEFFAFQLGVYAAQFFWRNFGAMLRASPTPRAPSGTRRRGRWSC